MKQLVKDRMHRTHLIRFARQQLRNDKWAEDTDSETLIAALEKPESFGNWSQLKTRLIGVLKHKTIDQIPAKRERCRHRIMARVAMAKN